MADDNTTQGLTDEGFRSLVDGLARRRSAGGIDVYENAAGVGCPNPDCDRGRFRTLFVSDPGWQQLGATRDGVHLCLGSYGDKRLVFVHDE